VAAPQSCAGAGGGSVMTAPPRLAYAAWIAVCVIWGTTYLGIRVGLEALPPALMGGVRWTLAGLLLGVVTVARGERLPVRALWPSRSEEHTSELQSRENLVCRLLLEKKNNFIFNRNIKNSPIPC